MLRFREAGSNVRGRRVGPTLNKLTAPSRPLRGTYPCFQALGANKPPGVWSRLAPFPPSIPTTLQVLLDCPINHYHHHHHQCLLTEDWSRCCALPCRYRRTLPLIPLPPLTRPSRILRAANRNITGFDIRKYKEAATKPVYDPWERKSVRPLLRANPLHTTTLLGKRSELTTGRTHVARHGGTQDSSARGNDSRTPSLVWASRQWLLRDTAALNTSS